MAVIPWTLPVWQVIHVSLARGFGGLYQEGSLDAGIIFHADACVQKTDKKYSDKQIVTDIPETWLIPEKNHSARNIYPTIFFYHCYWFDKIDVKDNC